MAEATDFYLPTGPLELSWSFYATGAGHVAIPPGGSYPHHSLESPPSHEFSWERGRAFQEYSIGYIYGGRGEFESEFTGCIEIETGNALLLCPGIWHRYRPIKEIGWCEYWVTFDGEYARQLHRSGVIRADTPVLNPGLCESIPRLFQDILDRLQTKQIGFQHIIAGETLTVFAMILAADKNQSISDDVHKTIFRAKNAIEARIAGTIVIGNLAAELNLSPSYFRGLFKKHTGLAPYQYHLNIKIGRAKQLLRSGDVSIKQIAKSLGFQTVFHFMRLFKARTGMTAAQWRSGSTKPTSKKRKIEIKSKNTENRQ